MKPVMVSTLFAAAAVFTPAVFAQKLDCSELKQTIEARLKAHGVPHYTLEVLPVGTVASGKEVGRCEDGSRKIMYSKGRIAVKSEKAAKKEKTQIHAKTASTGEAAKPAAEKSATPAQVEAAKSSPQDSDGDSAIRHVKTRDLIDSLHNAANIRLDYSWPTLPANFRELGRRAGDVGALTKVCHDNKKDAAFLFNVLAVLNHKLNTNYESRPLDEEEKKAISNCQIESLTHESAMVRTEAVWGLAFFHDPKHESLVAPLLKDSDQNVVREARTTMDIIQKEKRKR